LQKIALTQHMKICNKGPVPANLNLWKCTSKNLPKMEQNLKRNSM